MTHLRKITLEELERRNYTETTTRAYLHTIEDSHAISNARLTNSVPNRSANNRGVTHRREAFALWRARSGCSR